MPKYTVMSAVRTGGKLHREGEEVELDEAVAAGLVALGRITVSAGKAAGGKAGKQPDGASGKSADGSDGKSSDGGAS